MQLAPDLARGISHSMNRFPLAWDSSYSSSKIPMPSLKQVSQPVSALSAASAAV